MSSILVWPWPNAATVVERLGWVLLHSLWQLALVAILAGVCVRVLRRHSAALRYVVLVSAMAVSVAIPVATGLCQREGAPYRLASQQVLALEQDKGAEAGSRTDPSALPGNPIFASEAPVEGPRPSSAGADGVMPEVPQPAPSDVQLTPSWLEQAKSAMRPWLAWIVAGWSFGVMLCSLRPLLGWYTLRRLGCVGVSHVSEEVLAAMRRLSAQIGLRRAVRVCQSTLARVPAVVGCVRPMILLPVSLLTSIPAAQLDAILAHELAHVRRHDFVVNLLQALVETLFFYHPAVWWLSSQIRVEREHCCDDLVVALLGNRIEYGRALVAIEESCGRSTLLALGVSDGSLLMRVRRILGIGPARRDSRWPGSLVGLMTLGLVLLLAVGSFVVSRAEVAMNTNASTGSEPRFPPPKPDEVRGLDLSKVAVRGYKEAYRSTPDLYVPDPANPESWHYPKNVFQMPLAEHTWLKYPAGSGHFYIEHRHDGTPKSEQLYGPIDGDPFEILKLEELFRERLKPGANAGDPHYRLRLMFRTGDPGLIRRAARLIEPELARGFSRNEEGLYRRLELLESVREALREEAVAFRRPELKAVAAQLYERVAAAETVIDQLNDAVADAEYQSATYLQRKIAAKIPDTLWGKPIDGLRLALVPREWSPEIDWNELPLDTPLPASVTVQPARELQYQLVVENVCDHEIKLCGYFTGEEIERTLEVLDRNGKPVEVQNLHTTIPHFRSYWRLKPSERQLLSMPAVHVLPAGLDVPNQGVGYFLKPTPGAYTLCCSMRFGHLDNMRHRHVPGKSEWIGQLTTGAQKVTVVGSDQPKDEGTGGEPGPSSDEKDAWGEKSNGLRCRLVPVPATSDDESPDLSKKTSQFVGADGVTFAVELQNVSDHSLTLLGTRYSFKGNPQDGKLHTEFYGPELFDLGFTDATGKPVPRPARELVQDYYILNSVLAHEVPPGKSLVVLLRPAKFEVPTDHRLSPGNYRAKVRYRGPRATTLAHLREVFPNEPKARAWSHEVTSNEVAFTVTADPADPKPPKLVWGEAKDGLQAAVEFRPVRGKASPSDPPGTFPTKPWVATIFHVKNVSDRPIKFVSERGRQGDEITATNAAGATKRLEVGWTTGWPIVYRWTLQPGEVAQLFAAGSIGVIDQPGQYTIRCHINFASLSQNNGEGEFGFPKKDDWHQTLVTGHCPITIRPRTSADDASEAPRDKQASTAPANGLEFLKPYPKLHGLSLDMTEKQFLEIAKQQELNLKRTSDVDHTRFEIGTDDGHVVIVMFGNNGEKCSGIQRIRSNLAPPLLPGAPAIVLPDHLNVMAVGFARDSKTLVSVATEKDVTIRTWDIAEKKLQNEVKLASEKHGNTFLSGHLTLSPDRKRVMVIVAGQIGIWETETGKFTKMFTLPKGLPHGGLACTPDLSVIACGVTPGLSGLPPPNAQAVVWDVASGKVIQTVTHVDAMQLHCVALSADGKWLAT
jgi:beta-lactamase regulating signal transducer with metallopeptidase domain